MSSSTRSIPDYTDLCARSDGTILRRTAQGLLPRKTRMHKGGVYVRIKRNRRTYERSVAQLVLSAFAGECPPAHRASHLDGNPLNNHLANLAWKPYGKPPRASRRKKKK